MIRHLVMWQMKDGTSPQDARDNAVRVKQALEGLQGKIEGLVSIRVIIDLLPSSTRSMLLDSVFESEAALAHYQNHPEHLKAAAIVRSVTQDRVCMDFAE